MCHQGSQTQLALASPPVDSQQHATVEDQATAVTPSLAATPQPTATLQRGSVTITYRDAQSTGVKYFVCIFFLFLGFIFVWGMSTCCF